MTEPKLPVFVYGTLRPGQKNYPRLLQGRTLREFPARVHGRLYFVSNGGYPYVLPEDGTVWGDLVELEPEHYDETLQELDLLEEYDPQDEAQSVYLRRPTEVFLDDGRCRLAWIYYWNAFQILGDLVESGDFADHLKG